MYEIACAKVARRPSPFCWRSRMALAHKGFDVETVPAYFTEKDAWPTPNTGTVPIIVDGDRVVGDSWAIAEYLEERYPDRPSLFGGEVGCALARFVQDWVETVMQPGLARLCLLDGLRTLTPADQTYYRNTREPRFGMTIEELVADREARLPAFRASLDPLRRVAERWDFVCGRTPAYADYIIFGTFQWARIVSDFETLAGDDPVQTWRGRMLDLFGGLARCALAYGS
jgi:glutathione S-transferase